MTTKRISEREYKYVIEVLNSQFRTSSCGIMTKRLEKKFAEIFKSKYAISFINGTATLHAALAAAGVGPGDEVIVPALTMASTSLAVMHSNAVPIFTDIDPDTFTIDPDDIKRKLSEKTKAVIPVALYGLSSDMDPIMKIAKNNNLTVLEDAAQCFLGFYKNRVVGTIGHMASFSLQSSKHMTSGEGGMIITDDDELANNVRRFGSLGYAVVSASEGKITKDHIQDPQYERHSSMGFNYRMPELCAAVALGQVERLEELVHRRIEVADLYSKALSGCSWLKPQKVPEGYVHAYWCFAAKLDNRVSFSWHEFRKKYMEYEGDGIYGAWQLTYLEPFLRNLMLYPKGCPLRCSHYGARFQEYGPGLCLNAESIQPRLLQFKTNYFNKDIAEKKADSLFRTIKYFD